jgi:hypothetical protein
LSYAGRLGQTHHEPQQIACDCGAVFSERLVRAVNAATDAELATTLLAGRLNEVRCPDCGRSFVVENPVVLHDPAREVFCEIHPPAARTGALRLRAALLAALAAEPIAVPPYVRDATLVFGVARAADLYRSGALSRGARDVVAGAAGEAPLAEETVGTPMAAPEAGGSPGAPQGEAPSTAATAEAAVAQREQALDERARAVEERERAVAERERAFDEDEAALAERHAEADQREGRLDQRQAGLDHREDELAGRLREQDGRLRELEGRARRAEERERELEAGTERTRRREAELGERIAEVGRREAEVSGEITATGHRETELRAQAADLTRRERELAALADQLHEREQSIDARAAAGSADTERGLSEPVAVLLSRLEQMARRTGRAVLPAERGILLGRTADRPGLDRAVRYPPQLTVQLRVAEGYPVVVLAALAPVPDAEAAGQGVEVATWALDVADPEDTELFERIAREFVAEVVLFDVADPSRRVSFTCAAPLAENARYVRARAEALLQTAQARGASFVKAMGVALATPPDLSGRLTHAFGPDSFADLGTPAQTLDALRVVAHWSAPENFDFLVAVRCFPLVYYRAIVTRVLARALEFGLAMDDVCTGLALAAGLAPTPEALCEKSLASFGEVALKLRPNDLDAAAEWDNWRRLLGRADALGLRPDAQLGALAEAARRRAEAALQAAPEPPPPAAEPPSRVRAQLEREAARARARDGGVPAPAPLAAPAPGAGGSASEERVTVRAAPPSSAAPAAVVSSAVEQLLDPPRPEGAAVAAASAASARAAEGSPWPAAAPVAGGGATLPPPPPAAAVAAGEPGSGRERRVTTGHRPGALRAERELGAEARAWTQNAPPATVALRQTASEGNLAAMLDLCDQPDPDDLAPLLDGVRRSGQEQLLRILPALLGAHRKDERLEAYLVETLSAREPWRRQAAALSLALLSTPRAPDALLELLLGEEEELAKEVALALGLLGRKAVAVLRRAAVRTTKADADSRERLARALANVGARGEEGLVKSIMTDDESGASAVAARAVKIIPGIALELVSDGPAGPERTYTRKYLGATVGLRRLLQKESRAGGERIDTGEILGGPTIVGVKRPPSGSAPLRGSGPAGDGAGGAASSRARGTSAPTSAEAARLRSDGAVPAAAPEGSIEELDSGLLEEDGGAAREQTVPRAIYPSGPGASGTSGAARGPRGGAGRGRLRP